MRNPKTGRLDPCGVFGCKRPSRPRRHFCAPCTGFLYRWLHMGRARQEAFMAWHQLRGSRFAGLIGKGKKLRRVA